jgi:hypothetical protein
MDDTADEGWSQRLERISSQRPALTAEIHAETHDRHNIEFVHRKNRRGGGAQYWRVCMDCHVLVNGLDGPFKRSAVPGWEEIPLQSYAEVAEFLRPAHEERFEKYDSFKKDWWRAYNDYLKSSEWGTKRRLVMERDNGTCRRCSSEAEHVHHLNYDRVGNESMDDLVAFCAGCHRWVHSKEGKP